MSEEFVNIGRRDIKRFDAPEHVLGTAKFSSDRFFKDMLYVRFLWSSEAHARIVNIDTSKAKALPGVVRVYTGEDMPNVRFHARQDKPILAVEKVRFVGDEVAAVVAEDEETAEEALDLIEVQYERLPHVLDGEEAMEEGAPEIHTGGNVMRTTKFERGDLDAGFAEADVVVEGTYKVPMSQHSCQETRSCVAVYQGGIIYMWGTSQWPHNSRDAVAGALGIPKSKVIWNGRNSGGGFGNSSAEQWQVVVAKAAMDTGRPVKMVLTRNDEYVITTHRYPVTGHMKVGAKNDGTITALDGDMICDLGAYAHCAIGMSDALAPLLNGWKFTNMVAEGFEVYTNKGECGYLRDVGNFQGTFITNAMVMDLAKALGIDPLDIVLKNQMDKDVGINLDSQAPYTSCPQPDTALAAAEAFGWSDKWKGWDTPVSVDGSKRVGIGIAVGASSKGSMRPPMSGIVVVNSDGTAHVLTGSADTGTGTGSTTLPIIAAEELGVRFEDVSSTWADTSCTQDTGMQNGSTMTRSGGMGILMAARDAKLQLFEIAAPMLEADPEDLEAKEGKIFVKGSPENSVTIASVAARAPSPVIGRGNYVRPSEYGAHTHFHTAMAEVEVDVETGEVKILKYVASQGVGRVIFRLGAESQVEGAVLNGIDHAMFGTQFHDEDTGITLADDWLNYKLPTVLDVPEVEPVFVEQNDPFAPFGGIGLGEPPNEGPGAVIRSAILHACGAAVNELPIYPDSVLKALGKAG